MKMRGIKGIGIAMLLLLISSPAFAAQDSSVLLEKAMYAEETLGKLKDAMAIYKQIIDAADTDRMIAATAIYRLGTCYRKLGSEAEALSTFAALARLYPEQRDLLAKSLFLNMKPAPWADGEVMRMAQKRIGTEYAGGALISTYTVESGLDAGEPVWYLRYFIGSGRSPIYYSVTAADAETLLPIESRLRRNQTYLESKFGDNRIEVLNLEDGSQPARHIASTGAAYDAWQLVWILRRLPLQPGFEATVPVLESSSGSFANVRFIVAGRETITVPAGTFDCYKVFMISDDSLPNEQTFWITADSHAYVAKAHIDRINEFELFSVETVGKDQLASFEIPGGEITLSAPRQWYISTISDITKITPSGAVVNVGNAVYIGAPDLDSELSVTVSVLTSERPSAVKAPEASVAVINGSEFLYQVLNGTRESVTLAGLTGERFIAEVRDGASGDDILQYTYRLSSAAKTYTFTFQTGKDSFDKMRSAFESIMDSLRVK